MKNSNYRPIYSLIIPFLIILAGCSMDYDDTMMAENISEEIPDTIMYNFIHTAVRNGMPSFRIIAEQAETYSKKKETILSGIAFNEYDKDGEVITRGNADSAIFYTDTEDAELTGNLFFYSSGEEARVFAEYLYWNDEEKILQGKPEHRVRVERDSGSVISGDDFSADLKTKKFDFGKNASGIFVNKKDDEK